TEWDWVTKPMRHPSPIAGALTAFTDAGRKSRRAAVTWKDNQGQWQHQLLEASPEDSLQTLELMAVVWALANLPNPLNIVTDSLYVAGIVARIEDANIKEVNNQRLYELFL
ncbi:PO113 protein, partial [Chaetops frenatus]|nr:PO113 protein [Chaetops frenatus]